MAICWQEINEDADHKAIRDALGDGYAHFHGDLPIPISVRRDWAVISHGRRKTHDGKKRTSPSRWITWVVARHRLTGKTVVVVNTHMVSGAWNRKPKLNKWWRKERWLDHWQILERIIRSLYGKYGLVFLAGDFNRRNVDLFHPDHEWLTGGICKLGVVGNLPSGYELDVIADRRLNTDKPVRTIRVTLEEAIAA